MDVEEPSLKQRSRKNAVTAEGGASSNKNAPVPPPSLGLPPHHPVNVLYRLLVISISIYFLHKFEVFHQIMRGEKVDHLWFKIGLGASIAISVIKCYMEMFEGKMKKKKVEYENYKTATHSVMALFLLASFSFHKSLWGQFGGGWTILINFAFGFGILLQFTLLVPTYVQNIVTFVGLTFLIQEYQ
mmetsp:Transcript_18909/g.28746  ORF Transcript_18909/g.28746 Transcript_18909/m.28746 type:complete len:186 (-) Transcript_18909:1598-2155(-)